ncbi:MAG TPA: hypothetical protein VJ103_02180 [Candidatus Paceibacterota bacterium]|nr:hypothetical protein [Candidatus Paceibacterota bacterium]
MNIINSKQKIKSLIIISIVVLIGFGSFGLGRLSVLTERGAKPPVLIEKQSAPSNVLSDLNEGGKGSFVASKNGMKYYLTSCAGANRINEENKIYFDTKESAEAAGYAPSSTCKEL